MDFSFSYSYKIFDQKVMKSLPFDPLEADWKFHKKINCCLHFKKGKLLLRIKTDTNFVVIEEEGKSRPLLSLTYPIQSQDEFLEKTKDL